MGLGLALVAAGCGKAAQPKPVVGGAVGFDQSAAVAQNGPLPIANAGIACGSETATFGTELLTTSPNNAKVLNEWGEVVPGAPMSVAGSVTALTFSSGDLPFTHPFGKDVTWDILPDRPYQLLAQMHGAELPAGPLGTLHWELTQGEFPHQDTTTYLPGFIPANGDRVASTGHWIIDCGHSNFQTELHPPLMVALGHTEGNATVSHAFYVPYYETQLYTPIPDLANAVTDNTARFNDPNTLAFPQFLVQEIVRAGHAGPAGPLCCHDRLETHVLLKGNTKSPMPWFVCAPGPKGAHLAVNYKFTVRPGVTISATPNEDIGCVEFTATISRSFSPMVPQRKDCMLEWSTLDQQAQAATGNPDLKVRDAIDKLAPPSFLKNINKNPIVDCYDPLVVPAPGGPSQNQKVFVAPDQPFPFYGTATVRWGNTG